MNYGKKGSKKRQAELTSKGIMYGKKMRVIFCKVLLVCCFAVAIIGGSLGFGVYKGILDVYKRQILVCNDERRLGIFKSFHQTIRHFRCDKNGNNCIHGCLDTEQI